MTIKSMQEATMAVRLVTGRDTISTRVQAGMFQVVDVVFDAKGKSTVTPLSDWAGAEDTIQFLRQLSHRQN
jgi:hypothetical protein